MSFHQLAKDMLYMRGGELDGGWKAEKLPKTRKMADLGKE